MSVTENTIQPAGPDWNLIGQRLEASWVKFCKAIESRIPELDEMQKRIGESANANYAKLAEMYENAQPTITATKRNLDHLAQPVQLRSAQIQSLLSAENPEEDVWANLQNRQKAFLLNFVDKGSLIEASYGICNPTSHLVWLQTSPNYALAFNRILSLIRDGWVAELTHLALFGEQVPVYSKGQPVWKEGTNEQLYRTKKKGGLLFRIIKDFEQIFT